MQGIQLVILLTGATLGTAAFATWYRHRGEAEPWTRVLLGVDANTAFPCESDAFTVAHELQ
jgi:hypothetical protein